MGEVRRARRYAFTFVCQSGELEIKALLLAASLRRFLRCSHELIAAIPYPEEAFGRVTPRTLQLLETLGARATPIVNEIDIAYPIGNKVSCLRIDTDADKLVFLDSDILCLRPFADEPRFGIPFNAKPADAATFGPTVEAWRPIYALFGLPVPDRRVRSTVSGEYMPPYFNAGFIAVPGGGGFGDRWLACCRQIDASSLPLRRRLLDQLGLAVALHQSGLSFDCLDDRYNHPAHLVPLDPRRPPVFCHYHWPTVIRREPVLIALIESLCREWPDLRAALQTDPEWEPLLRRATRAVRAHWLPRRRSTSVATPDILVTGLPRSGTSYLCALLHRFDNCVALNEPIEIFAPLKEQPIPWGVATFLRDVRRDVIEGRPIHNKLRDGHLVEDTLGIAQRSEYTPPVTRPDFVLAVKNTLAFVNRLDALGRVLPDARIVACVRNPLDTIASWKRSFPHLRAADVSAIPVGHLDDPWLTAQQRMALQAIASMPTEATRRAAYWRYLAALIRDAAERIVIVRYEDLVTKPAAALERILHGWTAGRLREPIAASSVRDHRDLLDAEDRQAIAAICSDVAAALGVYEGTPIVSEKAAPDAGTDVAAPSTGRAPAVFLRLPRSPEIRDVSELFARSADDGATRAHEFRAVEAYCMFIGYPRSGHSLVGSLLDAHPEIVIAHELDTLGYVEAGFSARQIYSLILDTDRAFTDSGREWAGYQYVVPNQWQGRFQRLRVIGDKKGGASTLRLRARPDLLPALRRVVGVPVKMVHVVRNPYDNIATIFHRREQPTLAESVDWYFSMCETVLHLMEDAEGEALRTLRVETLVAEPAQVLGELCGFLGVECGADYLADCAELVWTAPRKTRHRAGWTTAEITRVRERMKRFAYLEGYDFDD